MGAGWGAGYRCSAQVRTASAPAPHGRSSPCCPPPLGRVLCLVKRMVAPACDNCHEHQSFHRHIGRSTSHPGTVRVSRALLSQLSGPVTMPPLQRSLLQFFVKSCVSTSKKDLAPASHTVVERPFKIRVCPSNPARLPVDLNSRPSPQRACRGCLDQYKLLWHLPMLTAYILLSSPAQGPWPWPPLHPGLLFCRPSCLQPTHRR